MTVCRLLSSTYPFGPWQGQGAIRVVRLHAFVRGPR